MSKQKKIKHPKPVSNDTGSRGDTYTPTTWNSIYNSPPMPGPSGLS